MESDKTEEKEVEEAILFFQDLAEKQAPFLEELPTNKAKTAILVDKSDKAMYDWAVNGWLKNKKGRFQRHDYKRQPENN